MQKRSSLSVLRNLNLIQDFIVRQVLVIDNQYWTVTHMFCAYSQSTVSPGRIHSQSRISQHSPPSVIKRRSPRTLVTDPYSLARREWVGKTGSRISPAQEYRLEYIIGHGRRYEWTRGWRWLARLPCATCGSVLAQTSLVCLLSQNTYNLNLPNNRVHFPS